MPVAVELELTTRDSDREPQIERGSIHVLPRNMDSSSHPLEELHVWEIPVLFTCGVGSSGDDYMTTFSA